MQKPPEKIFLIINPSHLQSSDSSAATFDDQNVSTPLDFPFRKPYSDNAHVIGSCHGLVCIAFDNYGGQDIVIWNPSTGDYRKLPNLDISSGDTRYQYGFGYDSSTNDYKIILNYEVLILASMRPNLKFLQQKPSPGKGFNSTQVVTVFNVVKLCTGSRD